MTRQYTPPVLLSPSLSGARYLQVAPPDAFKEADIQKLVHAQPNCLPINEIDPIFSNPIPICTELNTPAGPIDNLMITPTGLPVVVECKLWRNQEGRREVIAQILDYAKELARWSSADLHREVRKRLKVEGNPLLSIMRMQVPSLDEIEFNDNLSRNLRRGRFLLLIVGDGIREGVEAITEYIQGHAGLHFTLGLVELPVFVLPDGSRLVTPRILARTHLMTHTVVTLPEGFALEQTKGTSDAEPDPDRNALSDEQQRFWAEFLPFLNLDDPEQAIPKPARQGYISFMFPAPNGSSWLTVYRDLRKNELGLFLSASRDSAGEYAMISIAEDWSNVGPLIDPKIALSADRYGRPRIGDQKHFGPLDQLEVRTLGFRWLAERTNTFVNVLRPRVRSAVADYLAQTARTD